MSPDGETVTNLNAIGERAGRYPAGRRSRRRSGSARQRSPRSVRQEPVFRTRPSAVMSTTARRRAARGNLPAVDRSRALAVADRRNQAGFRRRRAGRLPRQRALHGWPAGRRRRHARPVSRRSRSDRSVVPGDPGPASPTGQRRARDRRGARRSSSRWAPASSRPTRRCEARCCRSRSLRPRRPVAPPTAGASPRRPAGGATLQRRNRSRRPRQPDATHVPGAPEAGSARDRDVQPPRVRWRRRPRGLQRQRAALAERHQRSTATRSSSTTRPATSRRRTNVHTEMMLDDVDPEDRRAQVDAYDRRVGDASCTTTRSDWPRTPARRT